MTVANTTNSVRDAGNGSKTAFDFTFPIYAASDLLVYKILNSTGVRTLQTITTDYTVSISTSAEGGTVTFVTAPSSLQDSFIERSLPYTQATNIPAVGGVREEQLEKGLDKAVILILQLLKKAQLSLKFVSSSTQVDQIVPEPSAGKVLGWDSAGTALENKTLTYTAGTFPGSFTGGADASKAASPGANDLYIATDTGRVYACYTAGTWVDVTGLSTAVDIASATTCAIGAIVGQYARITGTTTITGLGTTAAGTLKYVRFADALTFTHNATSLILPGGASITTAAGDIAVMLSEGSGNWRCLHYQKASGLSTVAPSFQTAASQSEMEAASSNTVPVTPLSQKWHPGMAKAWAAFDSIPGTPTISASHNVTSLTDNGVGDITVNWTTAFSSANYVVVGNADDATAGHLKMKTYATGSIRIHQAQTTTGGDVDGKFYIAAFGDQ